MTLLAELPQEVGSHCSCLVDDKWLATYGGANMLGFFDTVQRFSLADKQWTLMVNQPENSVKSKFFSEGRIASASVTIGTELFVVFGGSAMERDTNDFLLIPLSHIREDKHFSEIQTLM